MTNGNDSTNTNRGDNKSTESNTPSCSPTSTILSSSSQINSNMNKRSMNNMLKYQRQALKTKQIKSSFFSSPNNIPNAPWLNKIHASRVNEEINIVGDHQSKSDKNFTIPTSQILVDSHNLAKQKRKINENEDLAHSFRFQEIIQDKSNPSVTQGNLIKDNTSLSKRSLEHTTRLGLLSGFHPTKKHKENFEIETQFILDDMPSETKPQISNVITLTIINQILKKYGIIANPCDINLYRTAMTHKSFVQLDETKRKTATYDRLEWLGDSTIHDILSEYIYLRYEESEGFMTQLRSKIENTETLAILCQVLGLDSYIQKNTKYVLGSSPKSREGCKKMLADVFEAFIAAIRFDLGLEITKQFLINVIEEEIDFSELLNTETNYKNRLMQYCHKMRWTDPVYTVLKEKMEGKDFTMMVGSTIKSTDRHDNCIEEEISGKYVVTGIGIGSSKKIGEQQAAKDALINLGIFV